MTKTKSQEPVKKPALTIYQVIADFKDKTDGDYLYTTKSNYPRAGKKTTAARVKALLEAGFIKAK